MLQEFLLFIGLLLSLYGLSCAISSFVMWLVFDKEDESNIYVIQVSREFSVKSKIACDLHRLKNSGLCRFVKVVVVDCGLPCEKIESIGEYCLKRDFGFCKIHDLPKYLEKTSFQNPENTV